MGPEDRGLLMKTLIVDHSWTKIIERDEFARVALAAKIEQIEEIEAAIRAVEGEEAARNALNDGLIKHALTRCLENLQGSASVTEQGFWGRGVEAEQRRMDGFAPIATIRTLADSAGRRVVVDELLLQERVEGTDLR